MEGVSTRIANRHDRPELVRMSLDLLDEHRREYGSDVARGWLTERHVKRSIAGHVRGGAVIVAERAGAIVGFIVLSKARFVLKTTAPVGSISDLWVEPGARRNGIGGRLLAEGLAWLRERGYGRVVLNVTAGNGARRLYERSGFRVFSEAMEIDLVGR